MRYEKLCDLNDKSRYRVRNIELTKHTSEINELTFKLPLKSKKWQYIVNENLVFYDGEYYIIKTPTFTHSAEDGMFATISCKHKSDSLKMNVISLEEITPRTVDELMVLALQDTGWTVGHITVDKTLKRGLEATEQSSYSILLSIAEKFNGFLHFNSVTNKVDMLTLESQTLPRMNISSSKNLKSISITYDTSEMTTRLYCFGGDDKNGVELDIMSANPTGKAYVENYDYFFGLGYTQEDVTAHPELFTKTGIWRDTNYYNANDLYTDGLAKVKSLAKPIINISIEALNMEQFPEYKTIDLDIGNTVIVEDSDLGAEFLCNITKRRVNEDEKHILNIELTSNVEYRNVISQLFTSVSTANTVISESGTVKGSAISGINVSQIRDISAYYASLEFLKANYVDATEMATIYLKAEEADICYASVDELEAMQANIEELFAKYAEFDELNAKVANLDKVIADKADVKDLEAVSADIDTLNTDVASINNLLAGNVSAESGQLIHLTADNVLIDEAVVKSMIAQKMTIADLFTAVARSELITLISSETGKPTIAIKDSTQQFYDANGNIRVQIGQDANGKFNFLVIGEDGTTALFDENGITANAVSDGLIKGDMIADEGISKSKLNFPIVETDENGKVSITEILDENGDSFGVKYTEFQTTIQESVDNMESELASIRLINSEVFVKTNGIISPDFVTVVAVCKNNATTSHWYIDGVENTSYVSADKLSLVVPSSEVKAKKSLVVKATNEDGSVFDECALYCVQDGENAITYRIESTLGTIFNNGDTSKTTLTAHVYSGTTELDQEGAWGYTWYKVDKLDKSESIIAVGKIVEILVPDIAGYGVYFIADSDADITTAVLDKAISIQP